MTALSIQPPYPIFTEADGSPLENGFVYIGTANLDPVANPIAVYWDAALTVPAAQPIRTLNGYPSRNGTPARMYVASACSIAVLDRHGVSVFSSANSLDYSVDARLATATDIAMGDALVAVKSTLANSQSTNQHVVNEYRKVVATIDFGVPSDGISSATAAIQAMFNSCAAAGNVSEIYFPDGTYLLTNPRNDVQGSAAVVISGLKKCRISGGKNTKFIVNSSGLGASQFAMFRLENGCSDLEFCYFEMDGSGIVTNGTGANRSGSFYLANFDQNNQATNLTPNARIEFHHLYIHDIGGGPFILPRTASLPPAAITDNIVVRDCEFKNLLNVNHGVSACFVRNLEVKNNKFWNDIPTVTPIDCMAVDASRGCVNVTIENNWVRGFAYGMKCETQTGAGPSGTEVRESSRVAIINNRLEEIGDPASFVVGGDNTFGIRANGVDVVVIGNTVRPRTVGVTTGGLYVGIIATNTHELSSHCVAEGNRVVGCRYGIIHNDTTVSTRECSWDIVKNRFEDCGLYGASLQGNVTFDDNIVLRAGTSAVEVQTSNLTFVRRNRFIDCASADNPVIPERVAGIYQSTVGAIGGYTEFVDNIIIDTRGASAAEYGYFLRGATTFSNPMIFRPGFTTGMLTAVAYDSNFNPVGETTMVGGINRPGPRRFLSTNNPQTTAPWSTQPWNVGDESMLYPPIAGSARGWRCTVAGTPGTWVSLGNL